MISASARRTTTPGTARERASTCAEVPTLRSAPSAKSVWLTSSGVPVGPTAWPTRSMQIIRSSWSSGTVGRRTHSCEPMVFCRKWGGSSASNAAKITPRFSFSRASARATSIRIATAAALSSAPR